MLLFGLGAVVSGLVVFAVMDARHARADVSSPEPAPSEPRAWSSPEATRVTVGQYLGQKKPGALLEPNKYLVRLATCDAKGRQTSLGVPTMNTVIGPNQRVIVRPLKQAD